MTLPFVIGRRDALEDAASESRPERVAWRTGSPAGTRCRAHGRRNGRTSCTISVRSAGSITTPAFTSSSTSQAPGARPAPGGRYDELMARFGRPMPAVGVSLDLDTIAEVAV